MILTGNKTKTDKKNLNINSRINSGQAFACTGFDVNVIQMRRYLQTLRKGELNPKLP